METKKTKLKARRLWANYYADGSCRLLNTRASAKRYAAFGSVETAAVPVAVIPLHDIDKLIDTAFEAYWTAWALNSATCQQSMHDALAAIGVLPRKGRK
jgi:hypothetical protein